MASADDGASSDSDSGTASIGVVDLREDREWQDTEQDEESLTFFSLFDESTFSGLSAMLGYCKERYQFDLAETIQKLGVYVFHFRTKFRQRRRRPNGRALIRNILELDFLSALKLVNYIRGEVKLGNRPVKFESKDAFDDDRYLQPVLEDDAVLFSLDDLVVSTGIDGNEDKPARLDGGVGDDGEAPIRRIMELEQELRNIQQEYATYRNHVESTLDRKWETEAQKYESVPLAKVPEKSEQQKYDTGYFDSYSYNEIHETMLKDKVRTDAYRDFIYENKDLFRDKTVLDVGCGTGILSMFCARAGASKVIAVDNSSIIDKARANVFENGLGDVITCLRGKIEEVTLPVRQVDIIVSEWMGYCLLFEAMLDSVLWARDHYLRPDGLMVPSHCTLHISPVTNQEYVSDQISFWDDVYGFSMSSMREKTYFDKVRIRQLEEDDLLHPGTVFLLLPLHSISVSELTFSKPFEIDFADKGLSLDGWCVWFDTYFLRSRSDALPEDTSAPTWSKGGQRGVAFTTGPSGKQTHWESGLMLIDPRNGSDPGKDGHTSVTGSITYKKGQEDNRTLEIDMEWSIANKKSTQTWLLQ